MTISWKSLKSWGFIYVFGEVVILSDDLKKYVREQALRGVNPDELKKALIMTGWDARDVVSVVDGVYGLKKKIGRLGVFLIVLLVLVFSVSLLLLYFNLSGSLVVDSPVVGVDSSVVVPLSPCSDILDSVVKDECYFVLVSDGFVCDELFGDELFYCSRALELFILESFG